ncbi:glycoside hydrolase family 17 protein [Amniculicola lignicola CBS 123094]|uniref:Glycoside hydrolase family 17 protein n=1 Tax=Amniculicola lignicola CBS 123094 TaxID=1392246 RepID=A0A6A5W172_9PLEO|nr:glycoside hydrolase family 17 protein [Amniculicola lignicola CBS 123094]
MRVAVFFAAAASLGGALAQEVYLGFNSGSTTTDRKVKKQADFEKEFQTAQNLKGSPGSFASVRLYTNIQAPSKDDPIEAFPAAIKTNTKLLLGLWCSGTTNIDNEINALTKAIDQYGSNFTNLIIGVSVGSEDLYRVSESGVRNEAGPGQNAKTIVKFIKDVREALGNTSLRRTPVGHVDTWSAWANKSNKAVIDEVDFVGANMFPYYEDDKGNDFSNATNVFNYALNSTEKAAGTKPVWITETGWPLTGPDWGQAKATSDNAKGYWDAIGCSLFGRKNVWWYALRDSNPDNKAKFGISNELSTTASFNLTCPSGSGAPASINKEDAKGSGSTLFVSAKAILLAIILAIAL